MKAIGMRDILDLKALPAAVWHIESRQDRGHTMPWGTLVTAPPDGCDPETRRLILESYEPPTEPQKS